MPPWATIGFPAPCAEPLPDIKSEDSMRLAIPAVVGLLGLGLTALSCTPASEERTLAQIPDPPVAAKKPKELEIHGDVRVDN